VNFPSYNKIRALVLVLGGIAVLLGAFAAHGLKGVLTPSLLETWKTAVFYQFLHVFLLLFITTRRKASTFTKALVAGIAGIFLFSGSLYLYCLTQIKLLAMITPVGGVLFVVAWVLTAVESWKENETNPV